MILATVALAAVLLSSLSVTGFATAVEYKTNLQSNSVIVTDDQGKDLVATVTTENGFDSEAFDGTVVGDTGGETPVTEPTTPSNDNSTTTSDNNVTEIPDVVVVPVPTGNDTTVVVVTANDTAVIENGDNGTTNVTEIDNTNGQPTNQTTTNNTGSVEVTVDVPGVSNDTAVTPDEPISVVTDGNTTSTTTDNSTSEQPIECVAAPCGNVDNNSTSTGDNGTSVTPVTSGNDNSTSTTTEPITGDNSTAPVTPVESTPTNDNGTSTTTDNGGSGTVDNGGSDNCPIHGNIYQADGSLKEFKLCYT